MIILDTTTESLGSLARKLVKQGYKDQPFEGWHNGCKYLEGTSLYSIAKYSDIGWPLEHFDDHSATTLPWDLDPSENLSNSV